MLERGLREAKDRSEPSRHIALVTLDGACEYAIRFSAHCQGLPLKPEAGFHTGLELLRKALVGRKQWGQTGVRGVLELHAARNQVQHMGLLPDRELLSNWVMDAEAFIQELVKVAFDVQLGDVMLAEAIRDPDLRTSLGEAERALNADDATRAFLITDQTFLKARERWREQHGQTRREDSGAGASSAVRFPATPSDPLDHLEVQVFATDMSRYTQMLTTRRHLEIGGPEPDDAEARSALLFVFDWILSWEIFDAGYPAQRYTKYWQSVGPPQLDDGGPPRIAWHIQSYRLETGAGREEEYEMLLQLANIPSWKTSTWGLDFSEALASAETELGHTAPDIFPNIDFRGLLRVRVAVSADPKDVVLLLNRAVDIATERYERRDEDMRAAQAKAAELRESYTAVLRDVATGGVFGEATVTPELSSTGIRYIVGLTVPSATLSDLNRAATIFSGQGGHLAGTSQQAGKIVFEAFPLDEKALDQLRKAIEGSEEEILRYRDILAKTEMERQSFTRQIENLLGSAPVDIGSQQATDEDETE
ncbi:MAG: hypothetical protein ABSH36_14870 [Solirubrobacteraceae bacterium]